FARLNEKWSYKNCTTFLVKLRIWQVYAPAPKYIPCPSFINITVPDEEHQWDLVVIPPEFSGLDFFLYAQTVKDIASRTQTVEIFEEVYSDPDIPVFYPEKITTDNGRVFRFNRTLIEKVFPIQYAQEMLLPWPERSRIFKKILRPIIIKLNNTQTRLIGMSPADARKKKHVYANPSKPAYRPIGYDEPVLEVYNVRYLLEPDELEGGLSRRRAGDLIWSPDIRLRKL
ncbi:12086_t:CDS:2, partial [Ambispora gerdemannii]